MKRLIIVSENQARLLNDQINLKIIKNLVERELSVSELSREVGIPVLKIWRRVQALIKEGLIEQTRSEHVANLEKKMYRATAARYTAREPFEWKPKNKSLVVSHQKFMQIRAELIKSIQGMNDIPQDVDPIDYAWAVDLYAICKTYLRDEVQAKLQGILDNLAESNLLKIPKSHG